MVGWGPYNPVYVQQKHPTSSVPVHPAAAADVATDLVRARGTDLCQVWQQNGQQIAVRG